MSGHGYTEMLALLAKNIVVFYLSVSMLMVSVWLMYKFIIFPLDVAAMCWRERERADVVIFGQKKRKT